MSNKLSLLTNGNMWEVTLDSDPSIGSGFKAPIGSEAFVDVAGVGSQWVKFGPNDTDWRNISREPVVGSTGIQGIDGVTGLLGVTGIQGIDGVTGLIGATGIQGIGVTGLTGATGIQGIDGVTGLIGVTGIQGVTGISGATGVLGIDGVTGLIGSTGIQGIDGVTGETGIQGIDGVTGLIGVTGIRGIDGVTGLVGETGIQGVTGLIGSTGIQGIDGVTGLVGETGIQGVTGLSVNPNIYGVLQSDLDALTWGTGNNATFLGGGSIAGTFTQQDSTNPLNGAYSYTLTMASGSLYDYIASPIQNVPLWARGNTNSTYLVYMYDGADNDLISTVYDVTNASIIPVTSYIKASSIGKTAQLIYDLPTTCTQIRFGFQVLVANDGKVLKFDDVQLGVWTPQAVNLLDRQSSDWTGHSGFGSVATKIPYFTTLQTSSGSGIYTETNDSTNGHVLTFLKNAEVSFTYFAQTGGTNVNIGGSLNASSVTTPLSSLAASQQLSFVSLINTANTVGTSTIRVNVKAGDKIRPHTDGTAQNATTSAFRVVATSISENIIQTFQNGSEWTSYTPIFSAGFGTVTNAAGKWKRTGSDLEVIVSGTLGTVAGSLASVSLPSEVTGIDPSKLTLNNTTANAGNLVGSYNTSASSAGRIGSVILAPSTSTSLFYFGAIDGTTASHLTPANANAMSDGTAIFSFYAKVPIAGWSSVPQLMALPTSQRNNFNSRVSSTGTISSSSGDWINSITKGATGIYTINYAKLGLTVAPVISVDVEADANMRVANVYGSPTTTSVVVHTGSDAGVLVDLPFSIGLEKQSPDAKDPGVFVGEVSRNQEALIQYRGAGTKTSLSTTPVAMPLSIVKGDTSIVGIGSNQLTLQAGRYSIDWSFLWLSSTATAHYIQHYLYNITLSSETERGNSCYAPAIGFQTMTRGRSEITLTSATIFELRAVLSASVSSYLGDNYAAPNDMNGFIKITKFLGV